MIYVIDKAMELEKDFLTLYYNGFSYMNIELKFLQREPFIKISLIKYRKTDGK